MKKGLFITLEGGDGSGKTSMIPYIKDYLVQKGLQVIVTREPGGIEIAEQIRAVIHDVKHVMMDSRTEALLYAAARRQHLVEKVQPALEEGYIVLCDRFIDSSLAYQGYARGLGIDAVYAINRFAIDTLMPDLTLYLDIHPEVGLARINANNDREINRLDLENIEFHQKVREGYFLLLERFPERMVKVDVHGSIAQVFTEIKEILDQRLTDQL